MTRTNSLFLLLLLIFTGSCTNEKNTDEFDLLFPEESVSFEQSDLFKNKRIIPLETQGEFFVGGYPSLLLDEDFFVYSRLQEGEIFCFDKQGKFKHTIGKVGPGPEEYTEPTDVCLDKKEKCVEVLALNSICRYTYDGNFIEKIPIDYPAFSLYKGDDKSYWLYIGNNKAYSDHKLFKVNRATRRVDEYLDAHPNLLPLSENNFHKSGAYTTFHESYNNRVYRIEQDSLLQTHAVSFKELNLDLSNVPQDPMALITHLKQTHYATLRCYLENDDYIYIQVFENIPNEKEGNFFHWFINKQTKKQTVVKQPQNISPDSYLYAPQLLTANNELYFIGYPLEKESDVADVNENPSVIILSISGV